MLSAWFAAWPPSSKLSHHGDWRYWFWMDLAHYAVNTLNLLHQENVRFVQKEVNASCVASQHLVEHSWADWWLLEENFDDSSQAINHAEGMPGSTASRPLSIQCNKRLPCNLHQWSLQGRPPLVFHWRCTLALFIRSTHRISSFYTYLIKQKKKRKKNINYE